MPVGPVEPIEKQSTSDIIFGMIASVILAGACMLLCAAIWEARIKPSPALIALLAMEFLPGIVVLACIFKCWRSVVELVRRRRRNEH